MTIQVAIVEDDKETLDALKTIIDSSDKLYCTGAFEDAESISGSFKHFRVDVVLMDIELPGKSGIECVRQLKELRPEVQFIMFTNLEDTDKIVEALEAGATGYLVKNSTLPDMEKEIVMLYSGGSPMSPQVSRKIAIHFNSKDKKRKDSGESKKALTDREIEVMRWIENGYSYKEVAKKLGIEENTVRAHIRNVYEKLQVKNKMAAINKLNNIK